MRLLAVIVGLMLLGSVALILITMVTRGRERQIIPLVFSILSVGFYSVYYWDRIGSLPGARAILDPLKSVASGKPAFESSYALAWVILAAYIPRIAVFIAIRYRPREYGARIEDVNDDAILLFSCMALYASVVACVLSTYRLGWIAATGCLVLFVVLWTVAVEGIADALALLYEWFRIPIRWLIDTIIDVAQIITDLVVSFVNLRQSGDAEGVRARASAVRAHDADRQRRRRERQAQRERATENRHRMAEQRKRKRARRPRSSG